MNIHVLLITETHLWEKIQEKEPHLSNYVKKKLRFFISKYISAIQNEY